MTGIADRLGRTYREYPRTFWAMTAASFVDTIGGTLLFPFFALYITQRFGVGMTEAGLLIGSYAIAGLAGNAIGGAITDRFGRRKIVLIGLVCSAASALAMGFADDLALFYPLAAMVGLLGSLAEPARQAIIADVLPEEQRAEGFGLMRVVVNVSWIIGPAIGGFVASYSFLMLFILDTITSSLTALVVYLLVPETMPARAGAEKPQSMLASFAGYGRVLADRVYVAFIVATVLAVLVYDQLTSTLSVYLRDVHGVAAQGFGVLLSINAILVVLLQFWVTRRIKRRPPMLMMAMGTALYMVGFTMFGVVSGYSMFVLAVVIITVGEMITAPVGQALVAQMAPEDMRGRYMAVWGFGWLLPSVVGPLGAGLILDHLNPHLVWYIAGVCCALSAAGYALIHRQAGQRLSEAAPAESVP